MKDERADEGGAPSSRSEVAFFDDVANILAFLSLYIRSENFPSSLAANTLMLSAQGISLVDSRDDMRGRLKSRSRATERRR